MDSALARSAPRLEQLIERLKPIAGARIKVRGFRSTTPQYATEIDLVSGEGSRLQGGRWNLPGIAAVYASLSPETAMAETLAHFRYYGFPVHSAMPRTFAAIEVRLLKVLDLTSGDMRQRVRISESRLLNADWRRALDAGKPALTHLLGRASFDAGFEGLLVRSAVDEEGQNLVVFPDNLLPSSKLEVVDPYKLRH